MVEINLKVGTKIKFNANYSELRCTFDDGTGGLNQVCMVLFPKLVQKMTASKLVSAPVPNVLMPTTTTCADAEEKGHKQEEVEKKEPVAAPTKAEKKGPELKQIEDAPKTKKDIVLTIVSTAKTDKKKSNMGEDDNTDNVKKRKGKKNKRGKDGTKWTPPLKKKKD